MITRRSAPKIRHSLCVQPCHSGLSCALDITECIFHVVVLQNKTVTATGSLSHHALLLVAKNNPGTDAAKSTHTKKKTCFPQIHTHKSIIPVIWIVAFLDLESYLVSISQGLGGGLQSDLPITPWPTLSLTLWWGPMVAGTLWKVRKLESFGGEWKALKDAAIVWSFGGNFFSCFCSMWNRGYFCQSDLTWDIDLPLGNVQILKQTNWREQINSCLTVSI